MGLAYFMDTDEGLKIGLTELGAKFAYLNNPVIDDNSIVRKNAFSEDECIFIKKYIISRFELETMVTEKLVHRLMSLQSPDMPDKSLDIPEINKDFETQTLAWLQKEEKRIEKEKKKLEKPTTQEKNDLEYSYNIINKGRIDDKKRSTWRVATMGRLAEIKVVDWRIDQKGKSHYTAKNI